MGSTRAGQSSKKGKDSAAEASQPRDTIKDAGKISFPEVLVRWCRPDPPMRGTPPQPDDAQSGSIRLLGKPMDRGRQLREERRKQRKASSRGGAAGDRGGSDAGLVRAEAVMAMFREQSCDALLQEERPGRVPPSARASLLMPRDVSTGRPLGPPEGDEEDDAEQAAAAEDHQQSAATWEAVIFEVEQLEQSEVAAAKRGIAEARSVATQVKAQAARITSEAWSNVRREFEVQCQVWQSAALLAAARNKSKLEEPEKRPEAQLRAKLEALLLESADEGSSASSDAIMTFAATVREDAQQGRHLSKSVASAITEAERAQPLSEARHSLSRHLEAVAAGNSPAQPEGARREDLEVLVTTCRLEDTRVEYCARRVLGLSMSVGSIEMSGDRCRWDVGDDVREGFLSGSWGSQSTEPWAG